jgi:poly-beta-1,6-N-acetyl-D-glucosamine synthase
MAIFCVFAASFLVAAIVYIIVGHPLLLMRLSRTRGRGPDKRYELKTVSMLICVYNGEKFIADKLESVVSIDYPRELMQVFVLSDGSTDRTAEIARQFSDRGIQVVDLPRGGKPAALNYGLTLCTGEILVITDVRQTLERDSIRELVACFADPTIGVVSGDLPMRKGVDSEESNTSLYWVYEREIRKCLGRLGSTFGATGPFYGMRRALAKPMSPSTLLDDMFLPLNAYFQGYRVIVDETARALEYPFTMKSEFTRKVRTQAGVYQIMQIYPELLSPKKNPLLFHFVSYKIGRLALPWLFLALLIVSFALPWPYSWAMVAAQLAFYLAAAIDSQLPEGFILKKFTAPARAVVVMLAAAAMAVRVFFVPPEKLWIVTQARHRG